MSESLKIAAWDGVNKNRVRLTKLNTIKKFVANYKDFTPYMLTFPGTTAHLEKMVTINNAVDPNNIVAIQTYETMSEGHRGEPLLKKLIKTRNDHLKGMYIWPFNFEAFSSLYKLSGLTKPEGSSRSKFNVHPFKREMDSLVKRPTTKFNILDLDYCGIFSKKNAGSVENLLKNGILDRKGVMFITHQKGRDVRGGNLMNILNDYLMYNPMVDYDSIPNVHEEEDSYRYYSARYIMIPMYYVLKAFDNGYTLTLNRLIEYRDKNSGSGLAVNMLQYIFSWVQYSPEDADFAKKNTLLEVEKIRTEKYNYTNWVD